jgi:hypothetical protein
MEKPAAARNVVNLDSVKRRDVDNEVSPLSLSAETSIR